MGKTGNLLTKRVKKLFCVLLIFGLFCTFAFGVYAYFLIDRLSKDNGLSIYSQSTDSKRNLNEIVLQKDSTFKGEDIKILMPFLSESENYEEWLKGLLEVGAIYDLSYLGMNGYYEVSRPIRLSLYKKNDCSRVYCFQQRLGFEEIPSALWRGLIGIEDNRFLDHRGIDPRGILRAIYVAFRSGSLSQGGSTLTQQLVKNLFFTNERTLSRKINEMIVSIYIESRFSKEQILEAYFNEVVWGSIAGIRLKGVFAASVYYFNKRPRELTAFEGAILSALLKGPYYYHPLKYLKRLKERAGPVYKSLIEKKFISQFDKSLWGEKDWEKWVKYLEKRNKSHQLQSIPYALKTFDFYDQYILKTISNEFLPKIKSERPHLKDKDLAIKITIRDLKNCREQNCPDMNFYSKEERDLWSAIAQEKHQIGSLLKPFVYQLVFNDGKNESDRIETEQVELSLPSGVWIPEDRPYEEPMISLGRSLKKSRNITYIRMAREYGFEKLEKNLQKYFSNIQSPLQEYPAQLLGSLELSLSDLREAYRNLFLEQCDKPMDEKNVLSILSNPAETTLENYVGPHLRDQRFFGKTGTSNKAMDNWFVGLSDGLMVVTWFGLEGERSGKSLRTSGSSTAFKVYEQYKLRSGRAMASQICGKSFIE